MPSQDYTSNLANLAAGQAVMVQALTLYHLRPDAHQPI